MKLLRTTKGKLVAGVAAVGIVASGGVALANTDAGGALQEWYDEIFNNEVASIDEEVTAYGEGKLPGLYDEYDGLKDDATADISNTKDSETSDAKNEITAAKESHIEALGGTKEEILANIEEQFYFVYQESWLEINDLAEQGLAYATNDLTAHTNAEGEDAVNQVTEELNTAKEEAVTDLEDAIEKAKKEVRSEVDNYSEIAVRNITGHIDDKIGDVRVEVTELLDELVAEQQTIIANAAQELEDDAKSALDDVVAGMNE